MGDGGGGGGPAGMLGNMHADVLNHAPEDDAAKERLIEELKRRAKGAFGAKDMRSCDQLYSKAIEYCKTDATLYSNRAMVYLNLSMPSEALADCTACLKLDGSMFKAYYRKAQSLERLSRFDEAVAAIAEGREVKDDPSFAKLEEQVLAAKLKDASAKAEIRRDAQDTANAVKPQAPVSISTMVERQKKREAAEGEDLSMKGYRTKEDGTKTTFFHTEISAEAKALLAAQGTLPQKLEAAPQTAEMGGKSVWNSAGTWESKSLKKWVTEQLDAWVGAGTELKAPTGAPCTAEITSLEWEGSADVVMLRGKTKRMMDITMTISWTFLITGTEDKATGKLVYQDVCLDDEPEIRYEPDSAACTPAARPLADHFVKNANEGLQPMIAAKLKIFMAAFREL